MTSYSPLHDAEKAAGATFVQVDGQPVPANFGDPVAEYWQTYRHASVFDVSGRGKVELTGRDAPTFLHNLSTNDIMNLPLGGGCEAFFTNAKAKTVSHALVYHVRLGDGRDALWLDVAPGQAKNLIQHLDHFLISEEVEIADRTADFAQFHVAGPESSQVLARAVGASLPELAVCEHMERSIGDAVCHMRRNDPLGLPGYDLVCLKARAAEVWQRLVAAGAAPAGLDAYEILRVEAGTPIMGIDFDANRFVVEVGRSNAISYTKGCYLGQEPIVMARDRAGHVNRQFRGLRFQSDAPAAPGSTLLAADGKEVGVVTSSIVSPRIGPIGLGYVRRGHEQPGSQLTSEGCQVTVAALPMAE